MNTHAHGGVMAYIEQWPLRFVALHRSLTNPDAAEESLLDDTIESLPEGSSEAREMARIARSRYGERLMYVELQELGEDGTWSAMSRYYPEDGE